MELPPVPLISSSTIDLVLTRLDQLITHAENPYWRVRVRTIDLLVLISLDQLIILLKILFTFLHKATLMRRSTVLSLPILLVFPDLWTHASFYTLVTIVKIVTNSLMLFQLCNFDLIYVVNSGNTTVKNLFTCLWQHYIAAATNRPNKTKQGRLAWPLSSLPTWDR